MTPRKDDWRLQLMQFLGEVARRPLQFGTHDCALFAAEAVQVMTGTDLAAPYRGQYSDLRQGLKLLKADGYADHVALARAHLPPIPVAEAMPGDLAVIEAKPIPALGVVQGAAVYVLTPDGNLGLVTILLAVEAFRV